MTTHSSILAWEIPWTEEPEGPQSGPRWSPAFKIEPVLSVSSNSSILTWKIPWTEELGRLQSWGLRESDTTEQLTYTRRLILIL